MRVFAVGGVVAPLLVIFCCANLQAATPATVTPEVQQLKQVYGVLSAADHDYKGHRVKAMHSLEEACKLLGSEIKGDGKGHEQQSVSDAQLREAQTILNQARVSIAAKNQPKVLAHVDEAVKQLVSRFQLSNH